MTLSLHEVVRRTDGTLEIGYVRELQNTAIKHGSQGEYFIEVDGRVLAEGFSSPEEALTELQRRQPD